MKTTFDTDSMLFKTLSTPELKKAINGGIYSGDGDRPENSTKEDICVNSITLSQDYYPQIGTSNVNIYVPDKPRSIDGKQQLKADRPRLEALAALAMNALRNAKYPGLKLIVESQAILAETTTKQHFVNIRIGWNICA